MATQTISPVITFQCVRCGQVFPRAGHGQKYCKSCQPRARAEVKQKAARSIACHQCGTVFVARGKSQKWCSVCRPLIELTQKRDSTRRRRERKSTPTAAAPMVDMTACEYLPERLDLLAAAICGQAWRDIRHAWQDGEYIPSDERNAARGWWYEVGIPILGTICPGMAIPEVAR